MQKELTRYFISNDIENYELSLNYVSDSIVGTHCFTYANGSKIDCCLESTSVYLKRKSDNIYIGVLQSCYDDTLHAILVAINKDTLILTILDEHVFLDKNKPNYFLKSK